MAKQCWMCFYERFARCRSIMMHIEADMVDMSLFNMAYILKLIVNN